MNAAKAYVEVKNLRVFDDASGAPALVEVADYVFACDTLGKRTAVNCIKPGYGSRTESKIAARRARIAYESKVLFSTTGAWRQQNCDMYAEQAA